MIIDKTFFQIYFSDLNVPIAYGLLCIMIFVICWKKKPFWIIPFYCVLSVFSIGFLFDGIYEIMINNLFENWLYFVPIGLSIIIFKKGFFNKYSIGVLSECIILEILTVYAKIDFSDIIRYSFVGFFIVLFINQFGYNNLTEMYKICHEKIKPFLKGNIQVKQAK